MLNQKRFPWNLKWFDMFDSTIPYHVITYHISKYARLILPRMVLNVPAEHFTSSKLTIETLEQGVKYVQS